MENSEKFFCEKINQMSMPAYLEKLGFYPDAKRSRGDETWYISPLRPGERTPSFQLNTKKNVWFDFGQGIGGDFVKFGMVYHSCTEKEFYDRLCGGIGISLPDVPEVPKQARKSADMEIVKVCSLSHPALLSYLSERRIPSWVYHQYCKEVHYSANGKMYFAIGFPNDLGGWELRNKYIKRATRNQHGPTLIKNKDQNATVLNVFEGAFDFMSYMTLLKKEDSFEDHLILHGNAFFNNRIELMESYPNCRLFLDSQGYAREITAEMLKRGNGFQDCSLIYREHKDLNDYHQSLHAMEKSHRKRLSL